ncbi:TetR/AcrR family transcriptional regulator [Specibacter cremeus]|uniref:TetR/AcrR family transcriptional regulator n=1 Tax=Specibacter cremeus TaxID=1629051 RepID=UPI000F777F4F|nr:TetR/AcrR family transcriptional regulator [Specibacter cremeus]
MKRMNAQARRVEVLGETLRQIREKGMSTMRIADVAAAMNVSAALIIYHFETKENLLVEALMHAAERDLLKLRRIMHEARSPADRLMVALEWYAPTGQARGWQIWIDAWSTAMRDKTLRKVLSDLQDRWTDEIAAVIDEGVVQGVFRVDDSRDAATRITSMLDGLAVRMVVHKDDFKRDVLQGWLVRQVAWELGVDPGELGRREAGSLPLDKSFEPNAN